MRSVCYRGVVFECEIYVLLVIRHIPPQLVQPLALE